MVCALSFIFLCVYVCMCACFCMCVCSGLNLVGPVMTAPSLVRFCCCFTLRQRSQSSIQSQLTPCTNHDLPSCKKWYSKPLTAECVQLCLCLQEIELRIPDNTRAPAWVCFDGRSRQVGELPWLYVVAVCYAGPLRPQTCACMSLCVIEDALVIYMWVFLCQRTRQAASTRQCALLACSRLRSVAGIYDKAQANTSFVVSQALSARWVGGLHTKAGALATAN